MVFKCEQNYMKKAVWYRQKKKKISLKTGRRVVVEVKGKGIKKIGGDNGEEQIFLGMGRDKTKRKTMKCNIWNLWNKFFLCNFQTAQMNNSIPFSHFFFFSPSPSSSSLSLLFSFLIPFHLVSVSSFLLLLFRLFLFLPNNRLVAERLAARSRRRKEKKEKKEKTNASVNKWINKDFWSSLPVFFTNSSNSLSQSISQPFRVSLLLAFQNSHYHIYF